jgi:hypothetical protein
MVASTLAVGTLAVPGSLGAESTRAERCRLQTKTTTSLTLWSQLWLVPIDWISSWSVTTVASTLLARTEAQTGVLGSESIRAVPLAERWLEGLWCGLPPGTRTDWISSWSVTTVVSTLVVGTLAATGSLGSESTRAERCRPQTKTTIFPTLWSQLWLATLTDWTSSWSVTMADLH